MNKIALKFLLSTFLLLGLTGAMAVTTHTMTSGETLWELAAEYYADPTLYPILLEVNGIDNPRTIPVGTVIIIPNKSTMQKIAKETNPTRRQQLINQATSGQVIPPSDNNNDETLAPPSGNDAVSRTGAVSPEDTGFINVLKGPKVSPDKLIKIKSKNRF